MVINHCVNGVESDIMDDAHGTQEQKACGQTPMMGILTTTILIVSQ